MKAYVPGSILREVPTEDDGTTFEPIVPQPQDDPPTPPPNE
ncbi:hypothetical protein [Streptomyces sp. NBC_01244]|nr:hypothetical protein OG247_17990 [Streptomyces sp. NBC_01244]